MPDREKVIKEFEFVIRDFCPSCKSDEQYLDVLKDALALLLNFQMAQLLKEEQQSCLDALLV